MESWGRPGRRMMRLAHRGLSWTSHITSKWFISIPVSVYATYILSYRLNLIVRVSLSVLQSDPRTEVWLLSLSKHGTQYTHSETMVFHACNLYFCTIDSHFDAHFGGASVV